MSTLDPTSSPVSADPVEFALHAWVDESIHAPGAEHSGMYVLASVVADPEGCDHPRDSLVRLVPRGRGRLHWRDEDTPLREKVTAVIAECDFASVVVVGARWANPKAQERARRHCMRRLLFELEQLGVSQVWLESRTSSLNKRDLQLVNALRSENAISAALRVDFGLPSVEPMLWVPDAIAGAVAGARKGSRAGHRQVLGSMVQEIEIAL
ncbi:hypothetical protein [Nocardioides sp. zg-DK7169]|uniref:hypothetical protein n=1 Tax=Nocardioides sp. zg-DK7169 TaxID=2736600 RepID=UPI001557D26D|nr:hypothetical protein [Nocardioides sp. zg-DK7169]NPC98243.1 hypothetical protein [Nocardioides sp. zg-DK7169]